MWGLFYFPGLERFSTGPHAGHRVGDPLRSGRARRGAGSPTAGPVQGGSGKM